MKSFYSSFLWMLLASLILIGSCRKEVSPETEASDNPQANAITPGQAPANTTLSLTGSGLGDIRSITFSSGDVPAVFNPVFNTEEAVVFRVPLDAVPGAQQIVFTNGKGKEFSVAFTVLGLATITDVSNYNFSTGTQLTLTGKNLDDVTNVVLTGTTTAATIVSKTATTLVITMPATTLPRATLNITNLAGTSTTTQEFVSLDNAFKFFTDTYGAGYQDASWGDAGTIYTSEFKTGTASVGKVFAAGNWHQLGFGWTDTPNDNYRFLSFWVKGTASYPLWISSQTTAGGFASFNASNQIQVTAGQWTYYKIPLSQLGLWATGTTFNQIGWRIQGPNGQNETFWLDDVILVK